MFTKMQVTTRNRRARNRKGLTLIELMLVLVILVILASSVGIFVGNAQKNALNDAARAQCGNLEQCVGSYQIDVRSLPPDLNALVAAPSGLTSNRWRGPYVKNGRLPKDPWDQDYVYVANGANNFTIMSYGPDRTQGGGDDISTSDQSS